MYSLICVRETCFCYIYLLSNNAVTNILSHISWYSHSFIQFVSQFSSKCFLIACYVWRSVLGTWDSSVHKIHIYTQNFCPPRAYFLGRETNNEHNKINYHRLADGRLLKLNRVKEIQDNLVQSVFAILQKGGVHEREYLCVCVPAFYLLRHNFRLNRKVRIHVYTSPGFPKC